MDKHLEEYFDIKAFRMHLASSSTQYFVNIQIIDSVPAPKILDYWKFVGFIDAI
jgi:hypothetical protein